MVKYETWQKICAEFCIESGQSQVNHQKLRDMYKKDIAKGRMDKRKEYTQLVAELVNLHYNHMILMFMVQT